jgi:hypothetical protein
MIGDGFEKDALHSNRVGAYAIWFNPMSDLARSSGMHATLIEGRCRRHGPTPEQHYDEGGWQHIP